NPPRFDSKCVRVAKREKKRRTEAREETNQAGYGPGEFDMAKPYLQVAPCRHVKSKQAARDVDHVPVLNIFWFRRVAVNRRPKVNGLGELFAVDYAGQMNIARASIVTYSTRLHNRLIRRGRAIERVYARLIGKPGHGHGCSAVLQRHQRFVVFKLPFIAADEFMLKIDNSLAGSHDFADERQTHLAVSANFLRLIRDGLISIGNLDHISGRKLYGRMRPWRIRQRR